MMLWNQVGVRGSSWPWCYGLLFKFELSDLTNISFHMCGSWYLPIFLFRDGSFTFINIASLMVLTMFWSSLPTILKLTRDNSWLVMLWWSWMGDGAFMCSLSHTWTCRSLHSFARWYLCPCGVWGGPWWCCLLWKIFLPHVFCRCFHRSQPYLGCMGQLCRACCYCLSCLCFWLSLISACLLLLFHVDSHNFSIVDWEDQSIARTIKEAILIRANHPSLNRNIGKYQLTHIWDEVLVKSQELKFK